MSRLIFSLGFIPPDTRSGKDNETTSLAHVHRCLWPCLGVHPPCWKTDHERASRNFPYCKAAWNYHLFSRKWMLRRAYCSKHTYILLFTVALNSLQIAHLYTYWLYAVDVSGIQSRTVVCVRSDNISVVVDNSFCNSLPQPIEERPCILSPCQRFVRVFPPWVLCFRCIWRNIYDLSRSICT
jgi:Thrombospondin type 1 domain